MPAHSSALGEIFRTHGSTVAGREENGLENGQDDRGGPALSGVCLQGDVNYSLMRAQ